MKLWPAILLGCSLAVPLTRAAQAPEGQTEFRSLLVQAVLSEDVAVQVDLVRQLVNAGDDLISRALASWRVSELFVFTSPDGTKVPMVLDSQLDSDGKARGIRLADGQFIKDANSNPLVFLASDLTSVETSSR